MGLLRSLLHASQATVLPHQAPSQLAASNPITTSLYVKFLYHVFHFHATMQLLQCLTRGKTVWVGVRAAAYNPHTSPMLRALVALWIGWIAPEFAMGRV